MGKPAEKGDASLIGINPIPDEIVPHRKRLGYIEYKGWLSCFVHQLSACSFRPETPIFHYPLRAAMVWI